MTVNTDMRIRRYLHYNSLRKFFNKLKNIMFLLNTTFYIQGSINKKYLYITDSTNQSRYLFKVWFCFLQQFYVKYTYLFAFTSCADFIQGCIIDIINYIIEWVFRRVSIKRVDKVDFGFFRFYMPENLRTRS